MRHVEAPLSRLSFRLRLQHGHDLVTGAVVAAEAWPAWRRDGRPFPAAAVRDQDGAAYALLRAAAAAACEPGGVVVGINAEPASLGDGRLVEAAGAALAATGCPPHRLTVEIPEPALAGLDLAPLAALGVRVAADHYGTGPMSLRLLAGTGLAAVKLDAAIVREIDRNKPHQALVRAIAAMTRAYGLALGACGIETPAERAALAQLGVASGQGPLFAAPQRAAA